MADAKKTKRKPSSAEEYNEFLKISGKEFEELKKSDPIQALEKWDHIASNKLDEFIEEMKNHPDEQVRLKTIEVEKRIYESRKEMFDKLRKTISEALTPMVDTMEVFSSSISYLAQIKANHLDATKQIRNNLKYMFDSTKLDFSYLNAFGFDSPINIAKRSIIDNEEPSYIDSVFDHEMQFNVDSYKFLIILETQLRKLVNERIICGVPGGICNKLPPRLWTRLEEEQRKEIKKPFIEASNDPLDYSLLTDLREILDKGKNYSLFRDLIDQQHFRIFISKLNELEGIRNKIAHSRPLTKDEFGKFILYTKEFLHHFK